MRGTSFHNRPMQTGAHSGRRTVLPQLTFTQTGRRRQAMPGWKQTYRRGHAGNEGQEAIGVINRKMEANLVKQLSVGNTVRV